MILASMHAIFNITGMRYSEDSGQYMARTGLIFLSLNWMYYFQYYQIISWFSMNDKSDIQYTDCSVAPMSPSPLPSTPSTHPPSLFDLNILIIMR